MRLNDQLDELRENLPIYIVAMCCASEASTFVWTHEPHQSSVRSGTLVIEKGGRFRSLQRKTLLTRSRSHAHPHSLQC